MIHNKLDSANIDRSGNVILSKAKDQKNSEILRFAQNDEVENLSFRKGSNVPAIT